MFLYFNGLEFKYDESLDASTWYEGVKLKKVKSKEEAFMEISRFLKINNMRSDVTEVYPRSASENRGILSIDMLNSESPCFPNVLNPDKILFRGGAHFSLWDKESPYVYEPDIDELENPYNRADFEKIKTYLKKYFEDLKTRGLQDESGESECLWL